MFQRMVSPSTGLRGDPGGKAVGDAPADLPPTPGAGREVSPHGAQEMRICEVPGGSSTGPSSEIDAGDSELFRMEEAPARGGGDQADSHGGSATRSRVGQRRDCTSGSYGPFADRYGPFQVEKRRICPAT